MLLVGDIGGTKSILAVFDPDRASTAPLAEATLSSSRHPSLEAMAREFLSESGLRVQAAVFGIAGPVVDGRAAITNLPWVVDEHGLARALGVSRALLLNDLEAIALAVPHLGPDDVRLIQPGQAAPRGNIAVLAPGTGLGEAFLAWDGVRYRAHASEGGHCDFAPTDDREMALLQHLLEQYDHVSYERVCSGIGIPNLYAFLRDSGRAPEPAWLAARVAEAADATPVIVGAALDAHQPSPLCVQALELFADILGAEAGNLALKVFATGGVYLGGGIPPRILPHIDTQRFRDRFHNKGRMSSLLAAMPVWVILNPRAALLGAAREGMRIAGSPDSDRLPLHAAEED